MADAPPMADEPSRRKRPLASDTMCTYIIGSNGKLCPRTRKKHSNCCHRHSGPANDVIAEELPAQHPPSQPAVAPQIQPPDEVADQPAAYDFEAESESSNEEHVQNASIIEELSTVVKELNRRVLVLELDARLKRREAELAAERNASSTSTPLKAVKHFDDRVNSAKAFRLKIESQAENAMQTARALSYFSQPPSSEASASRPPSNEVPS